MREEGVKIVRKMRNGRHVEFRRQDYPYGVIYLCTCSVQVADHTSRQHEGMWIVVCEMISHTRLGQWRVAPPRSSAETTSPVAALT